VNHLLQFVHPAVRQHPIHAPPQAQMQSYNSAELGAGVPATNTTCPAGNLPAHLLAYSIAWLTARPAKYARTACGGLPSVKGCA
jgi:hypothetical protein